MKISDNGLDLIKKFEGFRPNIYLCPAGKPTIGYGHCIGEHERFDMVSPEEADTLLRSDVQIAENLINTHVTVPLTQGQFDALVSIIYNFGGGAFLHTEAFRDLQEKKYDAAALNLFSRDQGITRINGVISEGLVHRRQAEWGLWNGQAQV